MTHPSRPRPAHAPPLRGAEPEPIRYDSATGTRPPLAIVRHDNHLHHPGPAAVSCPVPAVADGIPSATRPQVAPGWLDTAAHR
jgi:hypothetical protein